jgi:hypothetical protein
MSPPALMWVPECGSDNQFDWRDGGVQYLWDYGSVGNAEAANTVVLEMMRPVSVASFGAVTYAHVGGNYFGNAKIYGSHDGATAWASLALLSGDGICVALGPEAISDTTKYPFYKITMFGNVRGTYETVSHFIVELR